MPISPDKLPAPKFTPEQQAADPAAKMTRVVKDFLKVGKWTCGVTGGGLEDWDITHEQLNLAAKTFKSLRENGHKPKLYWGNFRSDVNSQHEVATQDEISEIDDVIVDGDEAYLLAYVSADEAKRLENSSLEVSPAVAEVWHDSKKRRYENAIMHVAIVDHPVILDQGKFLTLSADGKKGTATRVLTLANEGGSEFKVGDRVRVKAGREHDKMAMGEGVIKEIGSAAIGIKFDGANETHHWYVAEEIETAGGDEPTTERRMANETGRLNMTLLEKLKAKFAFGDEVTADNIDAMIEAKINAKPEAKVDPTTSGNAELKQLAALVKEQGEVIRTLSADHKRLIDKEVASAETNYRGELTRLLSANTITRAFHDHYLELGKKHGYDADILKGLPLIRTLAATKLNTLELATPDEPDVNGGESDEARNKRLKDAGLEPLRVMAG